MKKILGALALVLVLVLGCAAVASADAGINITEVPEGKVVNWGDLYSITKIAGHEVVPFDERNVTIYPTCTEYGEAEFDCAEKVDPKTEKHFHIVRIAPLGHDWASEQQSEKEWGNVIKKPTCTETGLALDMCLRCFIDGERTREIEKIPHEYDDDHYIVYKAPTCVDKGLGQHICIYCDAVKKETENEMVKLDKLPHNFTEWKIKKESFCDELGAAERMCVWCGMHQKLDKDHEMYDEFGIAMTTYVWGVALKNPNWDDVTAKYRGEGNNEFDTRAGYNEFLDDLDLNAVEYEVTKRWLLDCYNREITFSCPICHGTVHDDLIVYQVAPFTISHVWKAEPDEELSTAPTCQSNGYNVYLCIYDDVGIAHGHEGITEPVTDENVSKLKGKKFTSKDGKVTKYDLQANIVKVDKLGHDYSPLTISRSYDKWNEETGEWETWDLWVATCQRPGCEATIEEAKKSDYVEPTWPHGFVLCDDGVWRLYDNGKVEDYTGFYEYDGGEFFLYHGELIDLNGMINCPGDEWVFMSHGQKQNVTKLVEYAGEWFFVEEGVLDTSKNGIYWYDGGRFVFSLGRLCKELNGLWQDPEDGTWWFIANGQVQDQYKGVAIYDGEFFLLDGGQLDVWYEGTLWYDGAEFKVVAGQLYAM